MLNTTPPTGVRAEPLNRVTPTVWRMHLQAPYAALIAAGAKTVEVRAAYADRRLMKPGDLIRFDTDHCDHATIPARVHRVTLYSSIGHMLDNEDPATIVGPGATHDDTAALLATIYPDPVPGYLAIGIFVTSDPV